MRKPVRIHTEDPGKRSGMRDETSARALGMVNPIPTGSRYTTARAGNELAHITRVHVDARTAGQDAVPEIDFALGAPCPPGRVLGEKNGSADRHVRQEWMDMDSRGGPKAPSPSCAVVCSKKARCVLFF
jgi:hypothetical protein